MRRFLRDVERGVLLSGPAGVAKTRLAGECLSLASTMGFVPLRITATQDAAGLPFGAYASIISALVAGAGRAEVLGQVAAAVVGRGEGRPVALFLDGAHLLDDASAALTHLLGADGRADLERALERY